MRSEAILECENTSPQEALLILICYVDTEKLSRMVLIIWEIHVDNLAIPSLLMRDMWIIDVENFFHIVLCDTNLSTILMRFKNLLMYMYVYKFISRQPGPLCYKSKHHRAADYVLFDGKIKSCIQYSFPCPDNAEFSSCKSNTFAISLVFLTWLVSFRISYQLWIVKCQEDTL